ncbi:MAG: hypothetical protein JXC32_01040, partial [Anaerolineae bacterium]|nr:hypothetical protein [Anaerolineae bacterium]
GGSRLMWPTAEVRWFSEGAIPEDVQAWFAADFPLLEVQPPRVDIYFPLVTDDGLGIKLREGRIEIKQRYGSLGAIAFCAGVIGVPELWRKWAFGLVASGGNGEGPGDPDGWIAVQKARRVRNYALESDADSARAVPKALSSMRGCSMELTQVVADGQEWWTVGFEASGAESELGFILETVARQALGECSLLRLGLERSYGYPRWLKHAVP